MNDSETAVPSLICANCGTDVSSAYCPNCGQHNSEHSLSVKAFAVDAFNEQLGLDSKVWRTLWLLFRHPGFLTREFVAGRRVRYMTPFKLYLLASFLFFLAFSYRSHLSPNDGGKLPIVTTGSSKNGSLVSIGDRELPETVEAYDKKQHDPKNAHPDSPFEQYILRRVISARSMSKAAFLDQVLNNAPKVVFLLMPFFALLLNLVYWRSQKWYIEHLIFALHEHSFMFLTLGLSQVTGFKPLRVFVLVVVLPVYAFISLRVFYQQGVLKTLFKGAFLSFMYMLFFFVAVVITALLTLAII